MAYKVLDTKYEIVKSAKDGRTPCEQCCFTKEQCNLIIDSEGFMACGCEFGGSYHCKKV